MVMTLAELLLLMRIFMLVQEAKTIPHSLFDRYRDALGCFYILVVMIRQLETLDYMPLSPELMHMARKAIERVDCRKETR